jgi:hypothetical protein
MTQRNYRKKDEGQVLEELGKVLYDIDAGSHYGEWINVLMAIKHETGGSDEGLHLADAWSSGGWNYKGTEDVFKHWRYLKTNLKIPITMGTLKWMAKNATGRSH